jgi:hypothetical protein
MGGITMKKPTISVRVNGEWVPIDTLPEQEIQKIKERARSVLRQAMEQQIKIMSVAATD